MYVSELKIKRNMYGYYRNENFVSFPNAKAADQNNY
jgi:hypothetical protein